MKMMKRTLYRKRAKLIDYRICGVASLDSNVFLNMKSFDGVKVSVCKIDE